MLIVIRTCGYISEVHHEHHIINTCLPHVSYRCIDRLHAHQGIIRVVCSAKKNAMCALVYAQKQLDKVRLDA